MATHNQLLNILSRHIGKGNGVSVKQLAEVTGAKERHIRTLIEDLRNEGHAICATPKDGYYIAGTPEELEQTLSFLHKRAMSSLVQIAKLKRISMPDLLGQLHVPT